MNQYRTILYLNVLPISWSFQKQSYLPLWVYTWGHPSFIHLSSWSALHMKVLNVWSLSVCLASDSTYFFSSDNFAVPSTSSQLHIAPKVATRIKLKKYKFQTISSKEIVNICMLHWNRKLFKMSTCFRIIDIWGRSFPFRQTQLYLSIIGLLIKLWEISPI